MAKRKASAKQKAWRAKFAQMVRSGRFTSNKRASARGSGAKMARKRYASRRRGSGRGSGMMGFIKPMLFGAIGDELATQASARGMNIISHQDKLAGAAGGFLAKRTPMGAILGVAGGMLKDVAFGRNPMASVAGGASGTPALELH